MRYATSTTRREAVRVGAWFFLCNVPLALLIAARYMKHMSGLDGALTIFYLAIATISHFTALLFIPFLFLFVPVAIVVRRKGILLTWGSIVVTASLGALLLDTVVYSLYRFHINRFTLELLFGGAGGDIFQFHTSDYLLVLSVLIFGCLTEWFLFKGIWNLAKHHIPRSGKWVILSIVLMMLTSHAIHAWADANCYRPITKASRYYPLYYPTTAKTFFNDMGWASPELNQQTLEQVEIDDSRDLLYPLSPIIADNSSKTNVLLILLDSWNHRAMDSVVTPNIARFAQTGQLYRNHYSGSNGTRTGVFSLFYSLPGTYWYNVLAAKIRPTFIDHLLTADYRFSVFTSASLVSPPFDQTVFAGVQGIPLKVPGEKAHDRDIQITLDWLDFTHNRPASDSQPFFGFLFYDALHAMSHPEGFVGPFQPSWDQVHYEKLSDDLDPTEFWNFYRNVARFEDSLVGLVLDDLQSRGLLENTVVIITGDHGQEFNENGKGYWGHNGNYSQAQVGVPLIIHWPGGAPETFDHWTSHYDIVPTLMRELFNCRNDIRDYSIGRYLDDSSPREWMLVGSDDHFGIIEPDRITSIGFNRTYDITDRQLNELPDASLNTTLINQFLRTVNIYYAK